MVKSMNPTEKGPARADKNDEPAFIRDVTAAGEAAVFQWGSLEKVAELCQGFHHFCEYCGDGPFLFWPMKEWAEHALTHKSVMTVQQEQSLTLFNIEGWSPAVSQWLSIQMITRADLRRRAYELGILRLAAPDAAPEKRRIHFPA